jgi:hypothetical protein
MFEGREAGLTDGGGRTEWPRAGATGTGGRSAPGARGDEPGAVGTADGRFGSLVMERTPRESRDD